LFEIKFKNFHIIITIKQKINRSYVIRPTYVSWSKLEKAHSRHFYPNLQKSNHL